MLGPINLVTALLTIIFALPSPTINHFLLLTLVLSMIVSFLIVGGIYSISAVVYLREQRKDGREFREEMKQVAEIARMEEALVADLAESLAEFGPTDTESRES